LRKESLQKTVDLGKQLGVRHDQTTRRKLEEVYSSMVAEEVANEQRGREIRQEMEAVMKAASEKERKAAVTAKDDKTRAKVSRHDHSSIQGLLKAAILHNYVQEGSKNKFERFRNALQSMNIDSTRGIAAEDVVRLIKATSGEDVDLEAAKSFIRAWDLNNDTNLDYDEFVRMLLTDPKNNPKGKATAKT
jgi:Ca2+-binding EF-hand superfamily protein